MRFLHLLNAVLWLCNAVLWMGWAHAPLMAAASVCAAVGSFWLSRD